MTDETARAKSAKELAHHIKSVVGVSTRVEVRDPNVMRLLDDKGDVRKIDEMEAETIRFAIAHYRGQMSEVARKLGIGRSTLYRKMKDLGLGDAEDAAA